MEDDSKNMVAPFVAKTYQMVNDPMTNTVVTWGKANNTFIVIDYIVFTQRILPVYFKHTNFSSFVRQLNTYGFRKVDPDKWEFGNEWFLKGQKHLLKNIVRRKHNKSSHIRQVKSDGLDDDEELVTVIARLKEDQKSLEEELLGMNKRLEATERRPQQMMTFLYKVVEDPDILPRMMLEKRQLNADKKRRLTVTPSSYSSSSSLSFSNNSVKSEEEDGFDIDNSFCRSSYQLLPSPKDSKEILEHDRRFVGQSMNFDCAKVASDRNGEMGYFGELVAEEMEARQPPPYPFSLFEGGF